jgi:hypothetical protein
LDHDILAARSSGGVLQTAGPPVSLEGSRLLLKQACPGAFDGAPSLPVSLEGSGLILKKACPVLACPLDPQGRLDVLRGRTRLPLPQPLIMAFIDTMRGPRLCGRVDLPGPARAGRAGRRQDLPGLEAARPPARGRTIFDAVVTDALRAARMIPDGRPTPESLYGRRKLTALLRRRGLKVAHCTVDRLMRQLGMQGVRRGKTPQTTIPGADGMRAADLLERDFTAPAPNRVWIADVERHEAP